MSGKILQYSNLRFRFFECKFFTFITLNDSGRTRLIFKINVKMKAWERFA